MDRSDNQLRASIKALNEVVGPAMDPGDSQAAQQLFLVTDYLGYLRARLDYLHDRDRFEVRHYRSMAAAITEDAAACSPDGARRLEEAVASADAVYERSDARAPELKAAAAALASAITSVVRDALAADDEKARTRLERRVVEMSQEKIEADRAWHLPQGFDPDPGSVLPLDKALGLATAGAPS